MLQALIGPGMNLITTIVDQLFETDEEKAEAKTKIIRAQQEGRLQELDAQLQAIVLEAKSADPWTSRARPAFMYVVYIYILAAIPMGFVFAFAPEVSANVVNGMQLWFDAIPGDMWTLFGVGYLGYTGARSYDKRNIVKGLGR